MITKKMMRRIRQQQRANLSLLAYGDPYKQKYQILLRTPWGNIGISYYVWTEHLDETVWKARVIACAQGLA